MPATRNYSSVAQTGQLDAPLDSGSTSMVISTVSGHPAVPYSLTVDVDTIKEEIVTVTGAVSLTLTVVRGQDQTVAQSHELGAKVIHAATGRDFQEARDHEANEAMHAGVVPSPHGNDHHEPNFATAAEQASTAASLANHIDDSGIGVHGATESATPLSLVLRDLTGRASVAGPSSSDHIANKSYVDDHAGVTNAHSASSAATPNRIVFRDGNGRTNFADPTSSSHAATKGYVDNAVTDRAVYKTANTTRSNTTTRTEDPHLELVSLAVGTYAVEAFIIYSSSEAADFSAFFQNNTGLDEIYVAWSNASNSFSHEITEGNEFFVAPGAGVGVKRPIHVFGSLTVDSSSKWELQWAQDTADVSNTTVYAGSFLRAQRLA